MGGPLADAAHLGHRVDHGLVVHAVQPAVAERSVAERRRDAADRGDLLAREPVRAQLGIGRGQQALGPRNPTPEARPHAPQDFARRGPRELLVDHGADQRAVGVAADHELAAPGPADQGAERAIAPAEAATGPRAELGVDLGLHGIKITRCRPMSWGASCARKRGAALASRFLTPSCRYHQDGGVCPG